MSELRAAAWSIGSTLPIDGPAFMPASAASRLNLHSWLHRTVIAVFGLSGTTVGIGLAIIRFASLGALPLSSAADRIGRRTVMLWCTAAGLALTAMAAISPSFWWFVAIVAIRRPRLTAANALR